MIKIGIYSTDSKMKKEIKKSIKEYFEDLDMISEISYIRTKNIAFNNITDKFARYNIMFLCDKDKITYIKRSQLNYFTNDGEIVVSWTDFPLEFEKLDDVFINENGFSCPKGIFPFSTKKTIRAINYGDIEYCKRIGDKTVIYLAGEETEELYESIKSMKTKMPEEFFSNILHGYIINFFNIKKIDRVNRRIIMKSGHEIPISKSKNKAFIRMFIKVIFGI